MASKNSTALKLVPNTPKIPTPVYPQTVIMQDDSMVPIFAKGDVLTINPDFMENPGDYVLVRTAIGDELLAIRRFTTIGDRMNFVPENPDYSAMLEDVYWANLECLGPVVAVQHGELTA
jgi:SOS-response transcriptional repressor LexA